MRIAFVWQGLNGVYGRWDDGLRAAMRIIEKEHNVLYFDTDIEGLEMFDPEIVLYWEAPCTFAGKDRENYWRIQSLPYKKALLFAGGSIRKEWCEGFDLFFVESKVNEQDFANLDLPWKRAFGVNTQIFKPEKQPKVFDGILQGTCASWKRQTLFSQALRERGAVCGRFQESDPIGFQMCRKNGTLVLPELSYQAVAALINASHTVVNTSDAQGGGQRCTLEAMACGIPPIVMNDSPKNMEYAEESGFGIIVEPLIESIQDAIRSVKDAQMPITGGVEYIHSKWTEKHYADAIMQGINGI